MVDKYYSIRVHIPMRDDRLVSLIIADSLSMFSLLV